MRPSATRVASRYLKASGTMYRGMIVRVPGGVRIRKLLKDADRIWGKYLLAGPGAKKPQEVYAMQEEATRLMEKALKGSVGIHWTRLERVARDFAKASQATSRGNTFHLVLEADLSPAGFDPIDEGYEPLYFQDEGEIRLPPGTPVKVRSIKILGGKYGGETVFPKGTFRA